MANSPRNDYFVHTLLRARDWHGHGDPSTPLNLGTAEELQAEAEQEPDDDKRAVLMQGARFTRIAQRYREAMLDNDEAALAVLERICLFRLGVDCDCPL